MVRTASLATLLFLALLSPALPLAPAGALAPLTPDVPDASAWRAAATTGAPLVLPVDAYELLLDVRVNDDLVSPDFALIGLDGAPASLDGTTFLTASIIGETKGWARVTLIGEAIVGHVVSERLGAITLVQEADGSDAALGMAALRAMLPVEDGFIDTEESAESCDSLFWQPQVASPVGLALGWPIRTFENAWAVDGSFVARYGASWPGAALSIANAVDGLYRADFGIALNLVQLVAIPDASLPGTTTDALLDSLQDHYVANYPTLGRENVHLVTAREMSNAAGQVNCVGSAGRTTVSYSVASIACGGCPYTFVPGTLLLADIGMKVSAHELAHTLSAHHHYANCVESARVANPFEPLDLCTVMINDWGLIAPAFSSAERLTARGWTEFYGL